MARHYVCGICGKNVATFGSWKDVEPSDLVELLGEELRSHNLDPEALDGALVLSRFRIVDDEDGADGPAGGVDEGTWVGQ